jgi:hypothetical protein
MSNLMCLGDLDLASSLFQRKLGVYISSALSCLPKVLCLADRTIYTALKLRRTALVNKSPVGTTSVAMMHAIVLVVLILVLFSSMILIYIYISLYALNVIALGANNIIVKTLKVSSFVLLFLTYLIAFKLTVFVLIRSYNAWHAFYFVITSIRLLSY